MGGKEGGEGREGREGREGYQLIEQKLHFEGRKGEGKGGR